MPGELEAGRGAAALRCSIPRSHRYAGTPPRVDRLLPSVDTATSTKRFWDPARRGFVQHQGSTTFDAAALLMPLVRFVSPTDPRGIDTLRGIERELVSDSLVYRYRLGEGF